MEENKDVIKLKEDRKIIANNRIFYTLVILSLFLLIYVAIEIFILIG